MSEFIRELNDIKKQADELVTKLELLKKAIDEKIAETKANLIAEILNIGGIDKEALKAFLEEPYVVIPKRKEEWYVIAPKFIPFSLGWLERSTKSYNIFIINKYVKWFAQIPKELERKLFGEEKPPEYKVVDGWLVTGPGKVKEAWKKYREYLSFKKEDRIKIKRGYEFQLISELVRSGILPFTPQPVDERDLREPPYMTFKLRDYQEQAWKTFLQYGACGIYHPFGTGKTMIGLWAIAHLKGEKLVVVPTKTLKEQWIERIAKYIPWCKHEVEVITYYAFDKVKGKKYILTIFDEHHRLPADTFIRLATIRTKYRLGLSSTPWREDGRTDLIIALTGYPVGLEWRKFFELGIIKQPTITLYVVKDLREKLKKLDELLMDRKKTLIFCDSIDLGKRISEKYNIPFVYGATRKRMDVLREHEIVVASRVVDEGVSLPEIERVIEVSFLYGSRRQEAQRLGRLFHSTGTPEHYILMTEEELERYEKRLYAIYEKGFRIDIVR